MRYQIQYVTEEQFTTIIKTFERRLAPSWVTLALRTMWATGCRPAEIVGSRFRPGRELEEGGTRISRRKAHHGLRAIDILPDQKLFIEGKHTNPKHRTHQLKKRVVLCADFATHEALQRLGREVERGANLFLPHSRSGVSALDGQIRKRRDALPFELRAFSPRMLRHGHAIHALQHGVDIVSLQRQLGHEDLTTTAIYLRYAGLDSKQYLKAFSSKIGVEKRDCPSCGFSWTTQGGEMTLEGRLGRVFRRGN